MSYIYKNLKIKIVSIACIYTHIIFKEIFYNYEKKEFLFIKENEVKTDHRKKWWLRTRMTKKLEESHLKCCKLENQLTTSRKKILKLTEEKE